jgi:glutamyl-tRNA synthetase
LPWVVRYEDIDGPRVVAGARERQESELRALGLVADVTVVQSANRRRHWSAFSRALKEGRVYPCYCSRKDVRAALEGAASAPHGSMPLYSGACRALSAPPKGARELPSIGWRFRAPEPGGADDFLVARTARAEPDPESFVPAYNWACAVDDFDGRYELLVRAWDLESADSQQRAVYALLGQWEGATYSPEVFHCALVTADDGGRLEKRTRGITLPELLARGFSTEAIVERFRKSFEPSSRVPGEARKTLRLSDLFA